jgi:uncharacterized protein (DUF58 family)
VSAAPTGAHRVNAAPASPGGRVPKARSLRERFSPKPDIPRPDDIDARLKRLELLINRRLEGLLHGDHLGLLPGHGSERAESREYRVGDDVRRMDWAVTARTSVPHVGDLIADRELTTYAVVDLTASMDFGTHTWEKRDLALAATTAFGVLTTRLGSRFGVTTLIGAGSGATIVEAPPRGGRDALRRAMRTLAAAPRSPSTSPSRAQADATSGTRPLTAALESLGRRGLRRGLVVVVSDLLGDPQDYARALRALTSRHQVLVVEIRDPREQSLPSVGVVTLTDPETGGQLEVNTGSAALRQRFEAAAAAQRSEVAATIRAARASHLVLSTDSNWLLDIARFVAAARRTRGAAR